MHRRTVLLLFSCLCADGLSLHAQGFVYTSANNWLTMKTSEGSFAFTDFGADVSMQVTDRLRIGAQVYDRKLGNLGEWHPLQDWAFADYRLKPWLSFRGGKVKTVIGLYNDTQDFEFLSAFALLPQSVYALDMRDAQVSHMGGDIYGDVPLGRRTGTLSYLVYGGTGRITTMAAIPTRCARAKYRWI